MQLPRVVRGATAFDVIDAHGPSTREKLLNALPGPLATQAETLGDWFLHDPDPWQGNRLPHGELRSTRLTVRPFERPDDFDLATFWQEFVELRSS